MNISPEGGGCVMSWSARFGEDRTDVLSFPSEAAVL